jgi:general secretion pathway protein A
MYLDYFGLGREPFHITPDPDFLFLSPSHKEAFATVVYGVEQRKGFVSLIGEVGTGKTTVLRAFLRRVENTSVRPVYLFNPELTFDELLRLVIRELGAEVEGTTTQELLDRLNWVLIEAYKANKNVALIVDEAQNIPVDTLERLRMLSNLETSSDKLIQIVLVGQPELQQKLDLHQLRQLQQRIAVRATINPLSRIEGLQYIQYRLHTAGCIRSDVFSQGALRAIVRRAKGNPRRINVLCDNALIAAFGSGEYSVLAKTVRAVIADESRRSYRRVPYWVVPAAAAALVCVAGFAVLGALWGGNQGVDAAFDEPVARVSPTEESAPPEAIPAKEEPAAVQAAPAPAESLAESVASLAQPEPALVAPAETPRKLTPKDIEPDPQKVALEMLARHNAAASAPAAPSSLSAAAPGAHVAAPPADSVESAPTEDISAIVAEPAEPAVPMAAEPSQQMASVNAVSPPRAAEPVTPAPTGVIDGRPFRAEFSSPAPVSLPAYTGAYEMRVVEPGETLTELVRAVYGALTPGLLEGVRRANPQIQDVNVILYGDTLRFPLREEDGAQPPVTDAGSPAKEETGNDQNL